VQSVLGCGVEVSYAAKAFATVEFLRRLAQTAIGVDVCSLGELTLAERAGFAPDRITLHGAGKSRDELQTAIAGRAGCIVVDGLEELERLVALASEGCAADVMLRLNVGVDAHTHAYVRTGGHDTKFGLHPRDEDMATARLQAAPQLRFTGLHAHIGSQIFASDPYVAAAQALIEAANRFAERGLPIQRIVTGGGFGVASDPDAADSHLDVAATVKRIAQSVEKAAQDAGIAAPRIGVEPGRSVVADAGTTLYEVLAVKRQSRRTFVIVDGGIFENPRPALYGARYGVAAVTPVEGEPQEMTICGRSCENDELATLELPSGIAAGTLLAMRGTGAYTYSMASNYNRFPRPAVAGVSRGRHALLARRETLDDLTRTDDGAPDASGWLAATL
jgi:diaminopimelate decarboxylase